MSLSTWGDYDPPEDPEESWCVDDYADDAYEDYRQDQVDRGQRKREPIPPERLAAIQARAMAGEEPASILASLTRAELARFPY